jgi:hypothetical protein
MDLLVNVDVDDLSKGIAFYQQTIGLQVGRRFGSLNAWRFVGRLFVDEA